MLTDRKQTFLQRRSRRRRSGTSGTSPKRNQRGL